MACVAVIKSWFNFALWILGAFIAFGLFSGWDAYQRIDFGQEERTRFVLFVVVTVSFVVAWLCVYIAALLVHYIMDPPEILTGWKSHVPWWLVQIVFLSMVTISLAVSVSKLSLQMTSEFALLKKKNYKELQRRIEEYHPILEEPNRRTGLTLMQVAFLENDLKAIRLFSKYGADPLTALELDNFSAFAANSKIIKFLVDHKKDPNAKDAAGVPLLFYMVKIGNIKGLELLLKAGADPEKVGINEKPLIIAVQDGNPEIVRLLVEYKADLNVQDRGGNTPLHICVQRHNFKLLHFLLEKGANARIFNYDDITPIHLAARMGSVRSIKMFLEKDPELVHVRSKEMDQTPFADALRGKNYEAARFLLKHGAEINRILKSGFTILHSMLISQQFENATFLVEEGADVHIVCKSIYAGVMEDGESAYYYMRRKKMRKLLKLVDKREGTHSFRMKEDADVEPVKPKKIEKELPPIL